MKTVVLIFRNEYEGGEYLVGVCETKELALKSKMALEKKARERDGADYWRGYYYDISEEIEVDEEVRSIEGDYNL